MEKETPKDKLLKACGVPSVSGQDLESECREAILKQAETARFRAEQAQNETDKFYRQLSAYIRDELPVQLAKVFEKVLPEEIARGMAPLHENVRNAACRIESCGDSLNKISWNARVVWIAVLVGIFTVLTGWCLVRYAFFGDRVEEAKRYEVYGRKVESYIKRYKPKDQEKLYQWIGGRP